MFASQTLISDFRAHWFAHAILKPTSSCSSFPDQMRADITYRLPETDWLVDPQISVNATVVAKQYNVARESDFARLLTGMLSLEHRPAPRCI